MPNLVFLAAKKVSERAPIMKKKPVSAEPVAKKPAGATGEIKRYTIMHYSAVNKVALRRAFGLKNQAFQFGMPGIEKD
eukprot:2493610-Alexandrium_andersonii.AAC.1